MATRELGHRIKPVNVLDSAVYAATQTTAALDSKGFESVTYLVNVGLWTAGSVTFSLQEASIIAGPYTVVAPGDVHCPVLETVSSVATDQQIYILDYLGGKRFTQLVATSAAGSVLFGVTAILGDPRESIDLTPIVPNYESWGNPTY